MTPLILNELASLKLPEMDADTLIGSAAKAVSSDGEMSFEDMYDDLQQMVVDELSITIVPLEEEAQQSEIQDVDITEDEAKNVDIVGKFPLDVPKILQSNIDGPSQGNRAVAPSNLAQQLPHSPDALPIDKTDAIRRNETPGVIAQDVVSERRQPAETLILARAISANQSNVTPKENRELIGVPLPKQVISSFQNAESTFPRTRLADPEPVAVNHKTVATQPEITTRPAGETLAGGASKAGQNNPVEGIQNPVPQRSVISAPLQAAVGQMPTPVGGDVIPAIRAVESPKTPAQKILNKDGDRLENKKGNSSQVLLKSEGPAGIAPTTSIQAANPTLNTVSAPYASLPIAKQSVEIVSESLDTLEVSQGVERVARHNISLTPQTTGGAGVARHVANQIVTAVLQKPGGTTELILNPEELGRVKLSLRINDNAITMTVLAERPETTDMLKRHIDALAQEFRELGYDSIEFSFGESAQENQDENTNDSSELSQSNTTPEEPASTDPATTPQQPEGGLDLRL